MIPVLETQRLILRAPTQADYEAETAFWQSDRAEFVGGKMTREQSWRAFATMVGHWTLRGYGFWSVEEKETGAYCGHVGLWNPEGWPEPELGWTVLEHAEGRGIAHEAALEARKYAYQVLDWQTLISSIDAANGRSAGLARKMGAVHEYDFDHERFGMMQIWRHPAPSEVLQ